MRVISIKRLRAFWEDHLDAEAPLSAWYKITKKASWKSIAEVRLTYPHADFVNPYTVFNIKGNDYRLIVKIEYGGQLVFIHRVLRHVEYDKDAWK